MTICVIENIPEHHRAYVLALRHLYPKGIARVIPEPDAPCQTWQDANQIVRRVSPREELIFVLDLALRDQGDASAGIEASDLLRLDYPKAILIAVTSFASDLKRHPRASDIFDGIIDKQTPEAKDPEKLREMLRDEIDAARRNRGKRTGPVKQELRMEDSLGMRLCEAAITSDGIRELVEKEAKGWTEVKVHALTSGNSGSYLLQICGRRSQQRARLVLKVAVKESILRDESIAVDKYSPILNRFAVKMVSADGGVLPLKNRSVYYCRMAVR